MNNLWFLLLVVDAVAAISLAGKRSAPYQFGIPLSDCDLINLPSANVIVWLTLESGL